MMENGDLILSYLQRWGVEYVFGVPGGSIVLMRTAFRY